MPIIIKKFTNIFVGFIFAISLSSYAQNDIMSLSLSEGSKINFYHLKLAEGMSQNSITYITQDSVGQMWFATKEGVVRYDAKKLHYYRHDPKNPNSIGGNFVERVYTAYDGSVWVGTQPAVLSKYNQKTDDFTKINGIKGGRIKDISQDKNNLFWITTNQYLYSYNDQSQELNRYSFQNATIGLDRLLITKSGRIFVTTNETYILEFYPKTKKFRKINLLQQDEMIKFRTTQTYSLYQITEDHNQNIWIAPSFGYLIKYNPETESKQKIIYRNKNSIYKNKTRKILTAMFIFEDKQNNLWVGTWFDGLYKIFPNRTEFTNFLPNEDNPNLLSNSIVHSGFQDKGGYYWFGTEFAGLNILKNADKFSITAHDKNDINSLPAVRFSFIVKDKTGRKWIGTMGDGIYFADKKAPNNYIKSTKLSLHAWAPTALVDHQKNVWFAVEKNLIKYNPETKDTIIFRHNPDNYNTLAPGNITYVYQDKNEIFWIGTSGGLTRFDEKKNKFIRFSHDVDNPKSLSSNYVTGIVEDKYHNIWVGTYAGLNKLNKKTGNFTIFKQNYSNNNSISSNAVNDLLSVDNNLWIATSGGGLVQYNLDDKLFKTYDTHSGLSDNTVKGIEVDNHQNLWLTTKHNIVKFDTETNQYINYDASDGLYEKIYIEHVGLQNLEFGAGFSNKDEQGNIYFGGMSGITTFHPDSLSINTYKPPTIIEYFSVNGIEKTIRKNNKIELKNQQNNLKFVLTTLNYIQPDKNQYAYKLKAYDTVWQYTGHQSTIEYNNIPPGNYTLVYKGANNDGVWGKINETPIITVALPFYKTTRFYAGLFILILLLIILFMMYRYYLYRKIEKQKQKLRYHSSKLKDEDAKRIDKKLEEYLIKNELYLEPDITLNKLAKIIDERSHYVSQVINQLHNKRFHEYINTFRIQVAKKMLVNTHLKIEAIAYDSGFNSLSTFNSVFKKEVGMTPSIFRKQNMK
jgi:ligand-binding sensor domain-containing protein/AraC-like DNA-binding protein